MSFMRKLFSFIRSMRFGILLLVLIAALSVVGTVIPQGKEVVWYVQTYPRLHAVLLVLKLYDVFNSWYFQLLLALLVLNLTLCSLIRIRSVIKAGKRETDVLRRQSQNYPLTPAQRDRLNGELRAMHCHETADGDSLIFRKISFGRYGSFITPLSILLTVVFGALALYLPKTTYEYCLPGESVQMDDGTEIAVQSFRTEDDEGRLDYTSEIRVSLPDGRDSGIQEVKVNHPLSFGNWKVYQQTYGTAGVVDVRDLETDEEDTFILTHMVLLSRDGKNGLWYEAIYPDWIQEPDGTISLVTNTSGSFPNPVYQIETVQDGMYSADLVFPGDSLQVDDLQFTFEKPMDYPGLRIKYTPRVVNVLLGAAFLLMIAGLFITFFCQPILVRVDTDGVAVGGPKPEGMLVTVQEILDASEDRKESQ